VLVQRAKPFAGIDASQVAAVMSMGASWDSGMNAADVPRSWDNVDKIKVDYRGGALGTGCGELCSADGVAHVETLATLLRRYNPQLLGLSSGVTPHMTSCLEGPFAAQCGLNAAVDGMTLFAGLNDQSGLEDVPGHVTAIEQARSLTRAVKRWPAEDRLESRWKVLTANLALGDQLWGHPRDIDRLEAELRRVLCHLRDECPYTYVNLLAVPDEASSFLNMELRSPWCGAFIGIWRTTLLLKGSQLNPIWGINEYAMQTNRVLLRLAEEFDDGEAFVVRYQPILRGFVFGPEVIDAMTCFHPNQLALSEIAYGLLDNMVSDPARPKRSELPCYRLANSSGKRRRAAAVNRGGGDVGGCPAEPGGTACEHGTSSAERVADARLDELRAQVDAGVPLLLR
jgi:hypothetical protein